MSVALVPFGSKPGGLSSHFSVLRLLRVLTHFSDKIEKKLTNI